jgi:Zn-dependent protease
VSSTFVFLLVWVGAMVIGVRLLRAALLFRVGLKLRFGGAGYSTIPAQEVPGPLQAAWEAPSAELMALGLVPEAYLRVRAIDGQEELARVFCAPDGGTLAVLSFGLLGQWLAPTLSINSILTSGRVVTTVNARAHVILIRPAATTLVDPLAVSLADQWSAHREALARQRETVRPLTLSELLLHEEEQGAAEAEAMVRAGVAARASDGGYELTLRGAWAFTRRILRAGPAMATFARRQGAWRQTHPESFPSPPLDEELRLFTAHKRVIERRSRRERTGVLFVLSLVAFAAAQLSFVPARMVPLLVAVLLFHELGHLVAMRAFGHHDARIFFIPFIGAVATARPRAITTSQEIIILLAGPIPGLLLGLGLLSWSVHTHPLGGTLVSLLLAINLFNLLPLYPLDGGQIVHSLVTAGRPRLELAVKGVTAVMALAAGLLTHSPTLATLGAVVLFSLRSQRLRGRVERAVRDRMVADPLLALDGARAVFATLAAWPTPLPFVQKLTLANTLLPRLGRGKSGRGAAVAWLLLYLLALLGGSALALTLALRPLSHRLDGRDRARAAAAVCAPDGRLAWPAGISAPGTPASAIVWCRLPDTDAASALVDDVSDRLLAEGRCLSFADPPDPVRALARRRARTYRLAVQAHAMDDQVEDSAPVVEAKLRQALAGTPDLDEQVLHAFAQMYGPGKPTLSDRDRLADVLGRAERRRCNPELSLYAGQVRGAEASFSMRAGGGPPLEALGRWLCARGCSVAVQPVGN